MSDRPNRLTYAQAGVDIAAGNALVERIKPMAAATRRPGVADALGGFGALFDPRAARLCRPDPGRLDGRRRHQAEGGDRERAAGHGRHRSRRHVRQRPALPGRRAAVLPRLFRDRASCRSTRRRAVIEGIAAGCREAGCALIGGETAEMPGLYAAGDFDLAGFAVGALERGTALPQGVAAGDVLLGLASSGVHSNGYSLVRRIVGRARARLGRGRALRRRATWPGRCWRRRASMCARCWRRSGRAACARRRTSRAAD